MHHSTQNNASVDVNYKMKLYETAVITVKSSTLKYAKKQLKWIRSRLIPLSEHLSVPVINIPLPIVDHELLMEVLRIYGLLLCCIL